MKATRSTFLLLAAVVVTLVVWANWRPAEGGSQGASKPAASASGVSAERSTVAGPEAARSHRDETGTGATLGERANAAQAALRFEQSRYCYFAQGHADGLRSVIQACRSLPEYSSQTQLAHCAVTIDEGESALKGMDQDHARCPRDVATARHFYQVTKAAAAQGSADAQACYVQFMFESNGTVLTYSQREVDDYLSATPRYISDGLARGDWRIVELLARDGHGDNDGLLPLVTKDDVYTQYVMNRLLQLGAEGAYAQQQERLIQAIYLSPGITTPPPLTQQQVASGTRRAQTLYQRFFVGKPLLRGPFVVCSGD